VDWGSGVDKAKNPSELTTTLHLARESNSSQAIAHLESILAEASQEDSKVLREIAAGDGKTAMIYIHRGPAQGSRFLITASGATIGRAESSEIFLDDFTVSRKHAQITAEDSTFVFKDLGSLNGSYINNSQTSHHLLQSGDEIQIGKFHMLFIGAKQLTGEK
jgi:pSer/pThr/pTyr-binding forkhead associated (FHA) protein